MINIFIYYADGLFPAGWILQQYGATPHTSRETRNFFEKKDLNFAVVRQFSDLANVGNVWEKLQDDVEKKIPKNLQYLKKFILKSGRKITFDLQRNLMDSTFDQLRRCIAARGSKFE